MKRKGALLLAALLLLAWAAPVWADARRTVEHFASFGDRTTGSPGARQAAETIADTFESLGFKTDHQLFLLPLRRYEPADLTLAGSGRSLTLHPLTTNAVFPQSTPEAGATGPLLWAGRGSLSEMEGKPVSGALVCMDLDSGKNWENAANLGAQAVIFVDRGTHARGYYTDKHELTPIDLPTFVVTERELSAAVPDFEHALASSAAPTASLHCHARWKRIMGENVYCLIPGSDPQLADQLVVIEAFYDSEGLVVGRSPGAEEASSIAALLELAAELKAHPPKRSVLLLATEGHAQGLAGIRDFVWSVRTKATRLMELERTERSRGLAAKAALHILESGRSLRDLTPEEGREVSQALRFQIKNHVDAISTKLMQLRLQGDPAHEEEIRQLARRRMLLRNLVDVTDFSRADEASLALLQSFVPAAVSEQMEVATDAGEQLLAAKSSRQARAEVAPLEVAAWISLHLSTHGNGVGAFDYGFQYEIRPDRNRNPDYGRIDRILQAAAEEMPKDGSVAPLRDTLRPSRIRPWESWFEDRPGLGGEVAALGGVLGLTMATVEDARSTWGTPYDTPDKVDFASLDRQIALLRGLVDVLVTTPAPLYDEVPRQGLSELEGKARFIRQGEVFPDQPAPGTIIQAYQGPAIVYSMVDTAGTFRFTGLADHKNTFHKVILEAYRFDPDSGRIMWAVDKKQTGKDSYRVKMVRQRMETDLVMFAAKRISIFGLLEPRTFAYLTKIDLYDGRRDATPVKYWFSRIDTRDSTLASFFLEQGTPLKVTLSDTVLTRKLILTHAVPGNPEGVGYLPSEWPEINATEFHVATDMWALLGPRIRNLETHGIDNERIRTMQAQGQSELKAADAAFKDMRWSDFLEHARASWALATRVYLDVEKTQRDVLLGVLFYIALFVPFAYCAERVLFAFADIHKRIVAFLAILCVVIAVIYAVHPAFQLTYSPLVVILAFFIAGLSALVAAIIFLRFEKEMEKLQRRAHHTKASEVSKLKAFAAAFVIGVSNLRRRKVRTSLTVVTLVILTFTIMSFTSVKSVRESTSTPFTDTSSYRGILMKSLGWASLPRETAAIVSNAFRGQALAVPRVWLDNKDRTTAVYVPLRRGSTNEEARGLIGLSPHEPEVSGLDRVLTGGRWFKPGEQDAVLLPASTAKRFGIDPAAPNGAKIELWGMPFSVVGCFDAAALDDFSDLDEEPPTPVTFPSEMAVSLAEAQADEIDTGEEMQNFQSRYQHVSADQVVIVPAGTALSLGGEIKSMALHPLGGLSTADLAKGLVDRFGLPLFVGQSSGTYLYSASDTINYSGLPNIVIPLVIAVCIVLNTMIASVYERRREIGVYTSIGMAPTHVSYLFIAEAVAFAVISSVLGYLLAQVAAETLSGTAVWSGMTANYSSLAGVAAMLLVIGVTLLSVIYPARVAAQIAIPDVTRSWVMPDSAGNEITLTLPFLLKEPEQECVGGFLLDYYQAHQDVTHGLFCSDDVACAFACPLQSFTEKRSPEAPDQCLNLRASIWLAPFDFGVRQETEIFFCPSEDQPEFMEIRIRVARQAGEVGIWKRLNKNFLNDLRKQLLVWRSLDEEGRAGYESLLRQYMARSEGQTG
ncbi:protein of unknown function DUF214 [Desulfovibrio sp. X2]|uniref:FtsX-like permease family protein n=1 Tax=Desulfovibrio sp. X2 TaxID=941449 RepID=UPI000358B9F3|nr:FtsX-like permease family protein [Desulfovibrio sp. X2]EPR44129.1 protein of unknown function DUF214 [Desulfovibrio sp. X2]